MATVIINKGNTTVEVQVDTGTYLFTQDQYDQLWHTMRESENYASDVLWTSAVTTDYLDPEHADEAILELDDFVAETCMAYAPEEEEDN